MNDLFALDVANTYVTHEPGTDIPAARSKLAFLLSACIHVESGPHDKAHVQGCCLARLVKGITLLIALPPHLQRSLHLHHKGFSTLANVALVFVATYIQTLVPAVQIGWHVA